MGMAYSNQLVGYQLVVKNKLAITLLPREKKDGPSGHYYRPALIWSVGATTKNGEAAAKFIDFFVNDIDAGKILGGRAWRADVACSARRHPADRSIRSEQQTVKYVDLVERSGGRLSGAGARSVRPRVRPERHAPGRADQLAFGKEIPGLRGGSAEA